MENNDSGKADAWELGFYLVLSLQYKISIREDSIIYQF